MNYDVEYACKALYIVPYGEVFVVDDLVNPFERIVEIILAEVKIPDVIVE